MSKPGFTLQDLPPILRQSVERNGWAICVGSGISVPLFPDWKSLVGALVTKIMPNAVASGTLINNLLTTFSPDAIIQAGEQIWKSNQKDFSGLLSHLLYDNVISKFSDSEQQVFFKCIQADPGAIYRRDWTAFIELISNKYPTLTSLKIAEVLNELLRTELLPSAILSFNAETLLPALINGLYIKGQNGIEEKEISKNKIIDPVVRSIYTLYRNRIPCYFCHGTLPLPNENKYHKKSGSEKLVFSESEYLRLSNSIYSWQSRVFLDVCSSKTVVFIGVSLSDPNMRKWLSWIHTNRMEEISNFKSQVQDSTHHYWIRRKPSTLDEQQWIEAAVSHLGIRLIWIDDWNDSGATLRILLGL